MARCEKCQRCQCARTEANPDPRAWPRKAAAWRAIYDELQDFGWHSKVDLMAVGAATGLDPKTIDNMMRDVHNKMRWTKKEIRRVDGRQHAYYQLRSLIDD